MNLKDQFVTHGEIDVLNLAPVEMRGSKGNIIDFGVVEIAIIKRAINKSDTYESSGREIAVVENATLKVSVVEGVLGIGEIAEGFL